MRKTITIYMDDPNDNRVKATVGYVSSAATQVQLYAMAEGLANLTRNDLVSVELTTVEELQGE